MLIFCGRKWRRGDSRLQRRPTRNRPLLHFFLSSPAPSFAIDRRRSISQWPLQSHSFFGRSWALRYGQESENKKASLPWTMLKFHGNQNRLAELHGSILSCLDPTIVQDPRSFRCSCAYFATQYNVHNENRQAGHLLSALRLESCMAAIIFPHSKMAQKIAE